MDGMVPSQVVVVADMVPLQVVLAGMVPLQVVAGMVPLQVVLDGMALWQVVLVHMVHWQEMLEVPGSESQHDYHSTQFRPCTQKP